MKSFDIFDTSLVRTVARPSDVFFLVAQAILQQRGGDANKVAIAELARLRIRAERLAIEAGDKEDVSLDEIYRHLNLGEWGITSGEMMAAELRLEAELVRPIARTRAEVRRSRQMGEPLIFISDTPIPTEHLRQMLVKAGIALPIDRIYASGDLGLTKASGRLFEYASEQEGEPLDRLVHTGDNPRSDVAVVRRLGMRAEPFLEARLTRYERILLNEGEEEPWVRSRIAGVSRAARLEAETRDGDFPALPHLAAGVIAPLLTCFVAWVLREANEAAVERLYFVSRDGEILVHIARELGAHMPVPECRYLYGSRQAWLFPAISTLDREELGWLLDESTTLGNLLAKLRLDPGSIAQALAFHGFEKSDLVKRLDRDEIERFWQVLQDPEVAASVLRSAENQRLAALAYLQQEGLASPGKWALVDVGWKLRSQRALKQLLDTIGHGESVAGYYLAVSGRRRPMSETGPYSALFMAEDHSDVQELFTNAMVLEEAFLSANHGSVAGYAWKNGSAVPVLQDMAEDPIRSRFTSELRDIATTYAREAAAAGILQDHFHHLRRGALRVTREFLTSPSREEAASLAWMTANDDPGTDGPQRRTLVVPMSKRDVLRRLAVRNLSRFEPVRRLRDHPNRYFWLEGSLAISRWWIRGGYRLASHLRFKHAIVVATELISRLRFSARPHGNEHSYRERRRRE